MSKSDYNAGYEAGLCQYWEVSESLVEFLELIEEQPALFSYFIEKYGDYYREDE